MHRYHVITNNLLNRCNFSTQEKTVSINKITVTAVVVVVSKLIGRLDVFLKRCCCCCDFASKTEHDDNFSDNACMNLFRKICSSSEPCLQSGQSNLRKMQHRRRTWTIQSYSPSCANVHSHLTHAFLNPPESTTQTASRSVQPFLQGSLV